MFAAPEAVKTKLFAAVSYNHRHRNHNHQHPVSFHCTRSDAEVQRKGANHVEKSSLRQRHHPQKTVTRNGREYTFWEARITVGTDPGTGKQIQKSFTGKTQK